MEPRLLTTSGRQQPIPGAGGDNNLERMKGIAVDVCFGGELGQTLLELLQCRSRITPGLGHALVPTVFRRPADDSAGEGG